MAEPFVGEIRLFSFGNLPQGWVRCEGQILQVQGNQALFSLIGNRYGGNGTTTFGIPDLRSRVPVSSASPYAPVVSAGTETMALDATKVPPHHHQMIGAHTPGTKTGPITNNFLANAISSTGSQTNFAVYSSTGSPDTQLNAGSISSAGGNQAHNNMQPYAAAYYCMATVGLYPSRS